MHDIATYQGPRPTQPCPAVDRHRLPFVDVTLRYFDEILNDGVFWAASVRELHLMDLDALSFKLRRLIQFVI